MAKINVWNIHLGHKDYNQNWCGGPNSAGGVSVGFSFKNNTEKTIKYAVFAWTPYNAVDDAMQCTIRGVSTTRLKDTGPIAPGAISANNLWENVWYNYSIKSIRLEYVYLEFMDGTEETVAGNEVSFEKPEGAGCYVATAVYGSYDCPQVWTLRRFRDNTLAATWYGRAFIKTYYAISPTLVKWFGETRWFKNLWRGKLDRMVEKLQSQGVESTPYEDKNW